MNQRRQVYIRGSFQRRFILQFCGIVLAGSAVFGALLTLYCRRTLTTAFVHSRLHVMSTADFLLPALGFITLIVTGLVALAAAARVLIFSHKIAGPLYRLEKTAKELGEGNLSVRVHLREGDELQAFANSLDGAVAELRRQVQELGDRCERIGAILEQLKRSQAVPQSLLDELTDAQAQMNEAIARFKV